MEHIDIRYIGMSRIRTDKNLSITASSLTRAAGEGVRMGRTTSGITAPMRSAAIMAAGGASADTIAAQLGAPVSRVQGWLRRDDVIALINGAVAQAAQLAAQPPGRLFQLGHRPPDHGDRGHALI